MPDAVLVERIAANLAMVQNQIAVTCRRAGRAADSVRLVTVTKGQSVAVIEAALQAGADWLGENYPEETLPKMMEVGDRYPVQWHMIGHLQSRKAKIVAQHFDMLESLDSVDLALRMDRLAAENGRKLPVLLEINVSGEASKGGFGGWEERRWDELADELSPVMQLANLEVRGLMTMPPFAEDPETVRPFFQRLAKLKDYLCGRFSDCDLSHLSMGTSGDYGTAIEEGATIVRIGTAIVGPRPKKLV